MWKRAQFRFAQFGRTQFSRVTPARVWRPAVAGALATSLATGSFILNDASASLPGVSVDNGIDPFPQTLGPDSKVVSSLHKLVATGVRSVTFLGFKVYGVGLYVPAKDEGKIGSLVAKHAGTGTAEDVLNDKEKSQEVLDDIAKNVSYTIRITPVRNTDFGHMRDGFVKTILSTPFAKTMKEEVGEGLEQLREVFKGVRGSVPKNHSMFVHSEDSKVTFYYRGKDNELQTLGTVTEPTISRVLLVLYLSSVKPISEPLRKDFVSYAKALVAGK